MLYSLGKERVPFFAACGEMWEILKPDGSLLCVVVGPREQAEKTVIHLNELYTSDDRNYIDEGD